LVVDQVLNTKRLFIENSHFVLMQSTNIECFPLSLLVSALLSRLILAIKPKRRNKSRKGAGHLKPVLKREKLSEVELKNFHVN